MSVVVTAIAPITSDMYDAVTERVMPEGQLPEGCQLHIAGPVDEGWRVITVWDTAEAFTSFREEKLLPAIREASGDEAPDEVKPKIDPLHRLVTA